MLMSLSGSSQSGYIEGGRVAAMCPEYDSEFIESRPVSSNKSAYSVLPFSGIVAGGFSK